MRTGLRALELLAGYVSLLGGLNLAGYFLAPDDGFLSLSLGAFLLLAFVFACRAGILRGYRIAAILVLLAPALLSFPDVMEAFIPAVGAFGDFPWIIHLLIAWTTHLLGLCMLVVLILAWSLAFGATAKAWYRQWGRAGNDAIAQPLMHFSSMSGEMKAGVWALRLLTGFVALSTLLSLVRFFQNIDNVGALIPLFMLMGAFPLLVFLFACLWGIARGYRIAAILALLAPVFLALPLITEVIALGSMALMESICDDCNDHRLYLLWFGVLFRLLMLTVLAAAWPLAFGAANSPRVLSFFARGFNACFEKCFGKQHAQWKRRQARIHAKAARALFEAATSLRQRESMPIESVIASYEDIERRYGENEAPAVRCWVERALQEKNEILRAQGQTAASDS
jgi:hypothetical protein